MDKNTHTEIVVAAVFLGLLVLFLNPFNLWMPDQLVYMMVAGTVVLFALFASFVWREKALDERDELHKMIAGRIGYVVGTGVLVFGVIFQTLTSSIDPWIVVALSAMVLGKIFGHIYSRIKH